jgi:type VI secretion system FHA domain protein
MPNADRLTLTIRNVDALDNGMPTRLELDRRGAIIGRSPTTDWSLPDPRSYISSRHCEIRYENGTFRLYDLSTNGTYLNGSSERPSGAQNIVNGDVIHVGHYEIVASLPNATPEAGPVEAPGSSWGGWNGAPAPAAPSASWGTSPSPAAPSSGGWGAPPPPPAAAAAGGWGAPPSSTPAPAADSGSIGHSHAWDPPPVAPAATPTPAGGSSPWDAPAAVAPAASSWSSAVADRPEPPSASDVWGQLTQGNVVDWARGGFGSPAPAVAALQAVTPVTPSPITTQPPQQSTMAPLASAPAQPKSPARPAAGGADMAAFLAAAGLDRAAIKADDRAMLAAAGGLLRRFVSGLVVMMEARARAKAQMGAQGTIFSREGNNPVKFARSPTDALAQMLSDPLSGFMPGERAVEDSFRDLQAHQMATLKAMQGALRATLDRFSPDAIRKRAETRGILGRILPGARDAALWQAYQKEFGGVAQGSDEAFMDVFAKEFRKAYEDAARG